MREALSLSAEHHANKQAKRQKQQQQQKALVTATSEGLVCDVGEDDEDDGAADALTELRDLLRESDDMPVYMEEAVLLKCQLQALEWANKAAVTLPHTHTLPVLTSYLDTFDGQEQERDQEAEESESFADESQTPSLPPTASSKARPRLAEVQRLAKEIKK